MDSKESGGMEVNLVCVFKKGENSAETRTVPTTDSTAKYFSYKLIPHLMCITRVLVYRISHSDDPLAIL